MADHLVSAGFFRREQVQVTGCPRFDFYHPFWRAVLAGPGVNAPAKRPRILINTNFSTRNPRFATVDQKIETSQRNFGWSRARIEEILSIEECAITAFIELSARLAEAHPECEILLRPHPFEGLDWYRRELASSPNVVVDNEGPVQPVLFGSALVIQRSCTTAVEAGLAGVPTLSPQWVVPPFLMPVAEAVSVPCDDYASLAAQVALVLEGRYTPSPALLTAIDTMIHDWFHRVDGEGYRRVARAILEALPPGPVGAAATARRRLYLHDDSGMPLRGIRRIAAGTRLALGLSPDWSFRHVRALPRNGWRHTAKFYDATRVQDIADRCTAILQGESVIPLRAKPVATQSGPVVSGFGHSVTLEAGP
jgi:hypothetical protein